MSTMPPFPSFVPELLGKGVLPSFLWPVKFCMYTTATVWALSIYTGNVSQVDRVWTFLPTIYTAYFALLPLWPNESPMPLWPYTPSNVHPGVLDHYSPRALLMLALVVTWMFRLSYNTWRRGLFDPNEEDYRWAIVRKQMPTWLFQVVNLVFIAIIQNIILFLLGIPTSIATFQKSTELSTSDYILGTLAIIDLFCEFTADNQQFSFQTYKQTGILNKNDWIGARIAWTPEDSKRGFITRGLWAWSRHPNFFCEQSFWVIITLFPLLAPESPQLPAQPLANSTALWPLTPALVLCSLFFSSTLFSESISASKYPAYKLYQQRVSMFVPFLTPLWGVWLSVLGKKEEVDKKLFAKGGKAKTQ